MILSSTKDLPTGILMIIWDWDNDNDHERPVNFIDYAKKSYGGDFRIVNVIEPSHFMGMKNFGITVLAEKDK